MLYTYLYIIVIYSVISNNVRHRRSVNIPIIPYFRVLQQRSPIEWHQVAHFLTAIFSPFTINQFIRFIVTDFTPASYNHYFPFIFISQNIPGNQKYTHLPVYLYFLSARMYYISYNIYASVSKPIHQDI